MIEIKAVSFTYEDINALGEKVYNESSGLKNINLRIPKGECVVLCGVSGCGKTSLTKLINGLIPNFCEGQLEGEIGVDGQNLREIDIANIAEKIGSVFQNPRSQFFNVDTTSELAFGCENRGMTVDDIRKRIDETSQRLSLNHLMERSIFELSGGEKQRIACGSVYATHPQIFVMDEPSSSLDRKSIDQLRRVIEILKGMGKTLVIAEHRLHYLKGLADRFVYMKEGKIHTIYDSENFQKLGNEVLNTMGLRTLNLKSLSGFPKLKGDRNHAIHLENVTFKRKKKEILNIPSLDLYKDEVVALIGDNGAGKTTLAHCLCGLEKFKGKIYIDNEALGYQRLNKRAFMVMQDVNSQLFTESVEEELLLNVNEGDRVKSKQILKALNLASVEDKHPMALSGGQKQRVAIATAMMANKDIIIYDEPTSGLDWESMNSMSKLIREMGANTYCTMIISHDPELILNTCQRVIHMEKGRIIDSYELDEKGVERIMMYFAI